MAAAKQRFLPESARRAPGPGLELSFYGQKHASKALIRDGLLTFTHGNGVIALARPNAVKFISI